uniref:Uncharacterized protein n=1 Tax=Zea mays TaxID=4577 RepID=C4IZ52_MAIZE|nr:unknown [Zea mays]
MCAAYTTRRPSPPTNSKAKEPHARPRIHSSLTGHIPSERLTLTHFVPLVVSPKPNGKSGS